MAEAAELLAAYDAQLRTNVPDPLPASWSVERDGPIVRLRGFAEQGFVLYRDLGGLTGADLDELIARQVRFFADRGERFEWKLHGHDRPADLPERLRAQGFVPEEVETIVIAPVADIAEPPRPPNGVRLRDVTARQDLDRIAGLEDAVWGQAHGTLADDLEAELAANPTALSIVVAEAGDTVVCAAWVRFERGTEFATLWGGATLEQWRGQGLYKSAVAHRANLALDRGFRYLETDASKDSRPILERLGFTPVTTTTPYAWVPSGGGSGPGRLHRSRADGCAPATRWDYRPTPDQDSASVHRCAPSTAHSQT
jgi:GNAT superfamily N-acetyltransferase